MTVSSPEIPKSDVLLHADCNELEVMCEMSRYSPSGSEKGTDPAYFMVSLSIDAMEFSTALILQIVEKEQSALRQSKLGLPLSPSGTVQTEGRSFCPKVSKNDIFLVSINGPFFLLSLSDISGVHSCQVCHCAFERRCAAPLWLQAAGCTLGTGHKHWVASTAPRKGT